MTERSFTDAELIAVLSRLRPYALTLARTDDGADDLLQDTAVRALERRDQYQPGSNLYAWLAAVMHNIHIDGFRKFWRASRLSEFVPAVHGGRVDHAGQSRIECRAVHGAFLQLPHGFRHVLALTVWGADRRDTATALRCPLGTVKSRINRARQKLARAVA